MLKFFSIISILFMTTLAHAQYTFNPAPASGNIVLTSAQTTITIGNVSGAAKLINVSLGANAYGISLSVNRCNKNVPNNTTCYFIVSFNNYTTNTATINIPLMDGATQIANLRYNPTVVPTNISTFNVSTIQVDNFDIVTLTVKNKTTSAQIYSFDWAGANTSSYDEVLNRCAISVPVNGSCTYKFKLISRDPGSYTMEISSAQITGTVVVSSTITSATPGSTPAPVPSIRLVNEALDTISFDTSNFGVTAPQFVSFINDGNQSIVPEFSLSNSNYYIALNRCNVVLLPGRSCDVGVVFNATQVGITANGAQAQETLSFRANSSQSYKTVYINTNVNIAQLGSGGPPSDPFVSYYPAQTNNGVGIMDSKFDLVGDVVVYYNKSNQSLLLTGANGNGGLGINLSYSTKEFSTRAVRISNSPALNGKTIMGFDGSAYGHRCVIDSLGKAYCWGFNGYGSIGDGTTTSPFMPTAVDDTGVLSGQFLVDIKISAKVTYARSSVGDGYYWGKGNQPVDPILADTVHPKKIPLTGLLAGKTISKIVPLYESIYGDAILITSDNLLFYFLPYSYDYGTDTYTEANVTQIDTSVISGLSIKEYGNNCLIASDDKPYCFSVVPWQNNNNGQLGNGSWSPATLNTLVAVKMTGALAGKTAKHINSGVMDHNCVIASDDLAYCWGQWGNGYLTGSANEPVQVPMTGALAGKTVKKIINAKNSGYNSCLIASDNKPYCFGTNWNGQLGASNPSDQDWYVPVDHSGLISGKTIIDVQNNGNTICVMDSTSKLYCIGYNENGMLGNGQSTNRSEWQLTADGTSP